ncbi:MAG: winged helix-turn-helix transcriptional regulator [Chloroflexi bacterium]|nr:winged helix-turn-helix transcriptional regulator [Chloroflexota bacterium]
MRFFGVQKAKYKDCQALLPKVSRRTLQRDLRALVERGLLQRRAGTNRLEYVLAHSSG